MNYTFRIIAVAAVIGWFLWAMSKIAQPSECEPVTFWSALLFSANMALVCGLGFVAGRESTEAQQ
jgi:hypothetical protein